ncbi:nickel-binding protein [Mucilaginibacter gotjawali]|uniref:Transcriptional activator FtrA n=2 Tax=Mucilaginibacter gotjawali TaxID=1550579 RepID=A0A110B1H8_9SPHI|nr:nickel-binding protein [Mucilaginibacter gotjawali]MBB3056594.1 AraC-like DNA-binding protein [Mucilaginibacter gotjawali]BAU52702.1 transcriptional activator FtrA [Mucilaginibacter gotjawali]
MPIFMDVHIVPGVKAKDVAEAHRLDLLHQHEHGCNCMTYWIDEARESIFCLIDAPDKNAVAEMHSKAHGLIPNKIIEVNSNLVEAFLGRIYDPTDAPVSNNGLKVFADPSFRILLVTKTADPVLLKHQFGDEQAGELLSAHTSIIRKNILAQGGREVEHEGSGFVVSFSSAAKAVDCALSVRKELPSSIAEQIDLRIAVNAGEPVERSEHLFGETIEFATNMCRIAKEGKIAIASAVKELIAEDIFQKERKYFLNLLPPEEHLLKLLFSKLEENWQDADFDLSDYCNATAMSSSQLYRKTIALTSLPPNSLLKDFRLHKAKDLMRKKYYNIAQITFDSGFTSASYFTKCFKKKYGLLPMTYLELLH